MKPYYVDGSCTIYHGDCREVLTDLSEVRGWADLLLTDPPYGLGFAGVGPEGEASIRVNADGVRQGVRVLRQAMFSASSLLADDAHLLLFCHWQSWPDFYDALSPYAKIRNALIWHKQSGGQGNIKSDYLRNYEAILYATRGMRPIGLGGDYSAVLTGFKRSSQMNRNHPTEKPVELLAHLIRRHSPEPAGRYSHVLDPFMGSGSTLVAARQEGRKATGIEIEERYCEIAAKRLGQEVLDFGEAA